MLSKPVTRSQSKRTYPEENPRTEDKGKKRRENRPKEKNPVLEGLTFSKDGTIVVDENLLRRLEGNKGEIREIEVNPFEECPVFLETLKEGEAISQDFLTECSKEMHSDKDGMRMAEIIGNIPLEWLALKRSEMREDNWEYNVKVSGDFRISDQENTGTCWAQSMGNILRRNLKTKFSLDSKFELSIPYVFFYDKLERCNLFLEYMWRLRDRDLSDREVRSLTKPSGHFITDGGDYNFYINIVSKYGIVPQNVYGKSINASVSAYMNEILITVLNNLALKIFKENPDRKAFLKLKRENMKLIYSLLVKFLGEPPKPTDKFNWVFRDEHGQSQTVPNLTPEKFYRVIIPHEHQTKVCIINDPRHPETYYMQSFVEYTTNVQGGKSSTMINLPMNEFKKIVYESLKNDEAVWMSCDVTKCLDSENKTLDLKRFDYSSVLGVDVDYDKASMLEMMTITPCHAMVFIGVDVDTDQGGNVIEYKKWRIENSWGSGDIDEEHDHGYFRMSDSYMDKYVFTAVVDLKYFGEEILNKIGENMKNGNTFTYKYYDAIR